MNIANEVWKQTSKAERSYQEHKEEWDRIFLNYRDGDTIVIPLKAVEHLIPEEYNYYSDGYLKFFFELGFNVTVPGPLYWKIYGVRIITLKRRI
jgi:hypothetical protein